MRRHNRVGSLDQIMSVLGGLAVAGAVALACVGTRAAVAQEEAAAGDAAYEQLPIPDSLDERDKPRTELAAVRRVLNETRTMVNNVLSGELPLQPNQAKFDAYYLQYVIPRMTWVKTIESPENFNVLVKARQDFLRDLQQRAAPPVHDHLLGIVLDKFKDIAAGPYHPAARINAMLVITELNQKELVKSGNAAPPEPYLPALQVMVGALADKNQIDSVRIVAMLGILRHVQWDARVRETQQQGAKTTQSNKIDDASRDRINQLALGIINAATPPAGRSADGHAWMQRRAIDILGALGTIGTNVNAATTIDNMVGDAKAPISLRCGAAEALGLINLPPEARLNPSETAGRLGELAVTACRNELKRIDDEKKQLAEGKPEGFVGPGGLMAQGGSSMPIGPGPGRPGGPGPGGPGPGMMGMMGGTLSQPKDVDAYKLEVAQRRLKSQLHSVKIGLAGVKGKTSGVMGLAKDGSKDRDTIAKLAKEVTDLRDMTDGEEIKDLDKFVSEVRKRMRDLETATTATLALAKPPPAPKSKPTADDPDDPDAPPAAKPAAKPAGKAAPAKPDEPDMP